SVMGVFMLLLGLTLIHIFLKGMFGIPFGIGASETATINIPVTLLALFIVLFVIIVSIKTPVHVRSYALLIGIVIGWGLFVLIFGKNETLEQGSAIQFTLFPLGKPTWDTGVVLT